jgi:hypothetical protein
MMCSGENECGAARLPDCRARRMEKMLHSGLNINLRAKAAISTL